MAEVDNSLPFLNKVNMKILLISRRGYAGYGCENCFINLYRLLKDKGHEVIAFITPLSRKISYAVKTTIKTGSQRWGAIGAEKRLRVILLMSTVRK